MVNVKYISSVEDLQNMGRFGYYKLTKNINCENFDFKTISLFEGTLDGDGFTIKNLKIQDNALIDVGNNVTIKNIQFNNLNNDIAGLINCLLGKCKFENIIIKDSIISGSCSVGGFFGYVYPSSIVTCSNCKFVNSKVSARNDDVGGFVGCVYSSSILFNECDVNNSNIITRSYNVGGFVGCISDSSVIVNDSIIKKSNLEGSHTVGGFVGRIYSSSKVVSVNNSMINDCKINAKEIWGGSVIGYDNYKNSVISNNSILNTIVMVKKKQVANKVGNIDISSTVRGHVSKVPSRKPTTRKTVARKPTSRKITVHKPTTCRRTARRV